MYLYTKRLLICVLPNLHKYTRRARYMHACVSICVNFVLRRTVGLPTFLSSHFDEPTVFLISFDHPVLKSAV